MIIYILLLHDLTLQYVQGLNVQWTLNTGESKGQHLWVKRTFFRQSNWSTHSTLTSLHRFKYVRTIYKMLSAQTICKTWLVSQCMWLFLSPFKTSCEKIQSVRYRNIFGTWGYTKLKQNYLYAYLCAYQLTTVN